MTTDTERNKIERRIRREVESNPVYREALSKVIGLDLKVDTDLKDKPVVAVLVPSYKSLHPNMLDARTRMFMYSKQFCEIFSEPIRGSSVVHWVRNDMLKPLYLEKRKFTHVLFIDDDMVFDKDVLVRMLRADKDVLGVNYVTRSDPPKPNVHLINLKTSEAARVLSWDQVGVKQEGSLITSGEEGWTLTAGTGLFLIKREVLDKVAQMYVNCDYEKLQWNLTEEQIAKVRDARKRDCETTGNYFWFKFLDRLTGFGESGEDTSFCIKAAMCGYQVWVDTDIQPGHIGEYAYTYADFLPYQKEEQAKKVCR